MKLDEGSSVRVSNLLNDFLAISWEGLLTKLGPKSDKNISKQVLARDLEYRGSNHVRLVLDQTMIE